MFVVGDRVVGVGQVSGLCIEGMLGTVIFTRQNDSCGVEWDEYDSAMHDCNGHGKDGHCWWVFADNIRLANKADEADFTIDESEFFKIIEKRALGGKI